MKKYLPICSFIFDNRVLTKNINTFHALIAMSSQTDEYIASGPLDTAFCEYESDIDNESVPDITPEEENWLEEQIAEMEQMSQKGLSVYAREFVPGSSS